MVYFVRNSSENKLSGLVSFCNVKVLNNLPLFSRKSQITYENNNNNSRRLPVRLYIGNPESLHKSYMHRGHLYLYCHV